MSRSLKRSLAAAFVILLLGYGAGRLDERRPREGGIEIGVGDGESVAVRVVTGGFSFSVKL